MAIIRTDEWLETNIDQPIELCERAYPGVDDAESFYQYLVNFGMYRSVSKAKRTFQALKDGEVWHSLQRIYQLYKAKWNGPEVDVYIFPVENGKSFFRKGADKSGLSLQDRMFLFIGDAHHVKELEALFVHEYHHIVRLEKLKRPASSYTLLDSLIMEGLAEQAVLEYCGEKYLAAFSKAYTTNQLKKHQEIYEENYYVKRNHKMHDPLLFGTKYVPKMMGYALGFQMIEKYKQKHPFSTLETINMPSEQFLLKEE